MIEFREYGIIAIGFDLDDDEQKVVVLRRPKLDQWHRFNEAAAVFSEEEKALRKTIDDDATLTDQERQVKNLARLGEDCIRWWTLVMLGDEETKGLAREKPPDREDWPLDLIVPSNIAQTTTHWLLPLAPGVTPSPPTTSGTPAPGLSTEPPST